MIEDNPFFGVGLRNFQSRYAEYAEVPKAQRGVASTYVAHNSYLQIWAESGSLAFGVYLALLGSVFVVCRRVHLMGRLRPDLAWCRDYARMMEATTIGFMIGATFLNRGHFDLVYHWLALVTSLSLVVAAAWRRGPPRDAAAPTAVVVQRRRVLAGAVAGSGKPQPRWGRTS
jgi:O-antigen ligase